MDHFVGRAAAAGPGDVAGEVHALGIDPVVVPVRDSLVLLVQRCEPRLEIVGRRRVVAFPLLYERRGLPLHLIRAFFEDAPAIAVARSDSMRRARGEAALPVRLKRSTGALAGGSQRQELGSASGTPKTHANAQETRAFSARSASETPGLPHAP